MIKNPVSQSGSFNPRLVVAVAVCLSGILAALIGFATTQSGWSIVSSPNDGTDKWNFLDDVTCIMGSDCWAIGAHRDSAGFDQTLVEHWDGAAWSIIPSPNSSAQNSHLLSVTCLSESDCWAVGDYSNGTATQTQIEHWDGVSWTIVASPNVNTQNNYLSRVSCVDANECWSVGYYDNGSDHQTLIEHWDGNSWSIVPSPNSSQKSRLFGVTCISGTDCWAVGGDLLGSTLTEHWDGVAWSIVTSLSVGSSWFDEISCLSSSQCWAVGMSYTGYGDPLTLTSSQTLIEQWDGSAWSIVPSPNRGTQYNSFPAVACLSASDCWAVGQYQNSAGGNGALISHWDGNAWSIVDSPINPNGFGDNLTGISCLPTSGCWAVGQYINDTSNPAMPVSQTLIEEYFPGPTPTPTVTPTATATPTPTPTPTVQVTVQTNPAGLTFVVDGITYSGSQTFVWPTGSSHTIATTSSQSGGTGIQYKFSSWSDRGAMSHTVAPTKNTTYTANFATQYYLAMNAGTGGRVSPTSGWRNAGSIVSLTATPTNNTMVSYSFSGWTGSGTGSYSGSNNPASISINGPITETASFVQGPVQVIVQTSVVGPTFSVDGTPYSSAQTFSWTPGSSHTIATTSPQNAGTGVRYVWSNWSDGGAISHTVTPTTNKTYTAKFTTQYFLTMSAGTGGTVTPLSGWKNNGAVVSIIAKPATGYSFTSWSGTGTESFSGTTNPVSITMSSPITEAASFTHN